jgi:hypothetical protein
MSPREFLEVADEWATGTREAEWRPAVSRAYYAAFHGARAVLQQAGFVVPQGDQAHAYLWLLRGFEWHYLRGLCRPSRWVWQGHQGEVFGVAAPRGGKAVATVGRDNTVRLWDPAGGGCCSTGIKQGHRPSGRGSAVEGVPWPQPLSRTGRKQGKAGGSS